MKSIPESEPSGCVCVLRGNGHLRGVSLCPSPGDDQRRRHHCHADEEMGSR